MMVNLSKLVEGCVDAHITAVTTKDAAKQFRALVQHAYDLGVHDGKKSEKQEDNDKDRPQSQADKSRAKEKRASQVSEEGSQSHQGNAPSVLEDEKAKAAKAIASL